MKNILKSLAVVGLVLFSSIPVISAANNELTIVTSFPSDLTNVFQRGFNKKYPSINMEILNKSTSSGVKYLQETASNNKSDLFWASAPDAFEVLKDSSLLKKFKSSAVGLPEKVGAFPINDVDGYYKGFAASGYGIMWNTRYIKAKKIPVPQEWSDLTKAVYHNHVGMSAPSRSGTTHLTVETILQGKGWEEGWKLLKQISGNFKTVTARSFGVPDGVNSGDFGIGIVIDFFALSSQASNFPVDFRYPTTTTLIPANIAIVANAPNEENAAKFINFILSPEGQDLLLDPKIRRLPINPKTYAKAPKDFPNPYTDSSIGAEVKFDLEVSKNRYNLVNSMFDVMVTYRLDLLRKVTKAIYDAEASLSKKPNAEAAKLIEQAKKLVAILPISEAKSFDQDFSDIFKKKRKKKADKVEGRQAEVEQEWDKFVVDNYNNALKIAKKAKSLL